MRYCKQGPVVQWIEWQVSTLLVGGSNPSGATMMYHNVPSLHDVGLAKKAEKTILQCRTADRSLSYLHIYEKLFGSVFSRFDKINILEIGTRYGGSVKMWLDYFPNAKVIGFDNLTDSTAIDLTDCDPRFTFIRGDQANLDDLKKIIDICDAFDIIIDDASHIIRSFVFSFEYLFPFLTDHGFYCIEDLYNNYKFWNSKQQRKTADNQDGEEFDAFVARLQKQIHKSTILEYNYAKSEVFSLQVYPGLLIARKDL